MILFWLWEHLIQGSSSDPVPVLLLPSASSLRVVGVHCSTAPGLCLPGAQRETQGHLKQADSMRVHSQRVCWKGLVQGNHWEWHSDLVLAGGEELLPSDLNDLERVVEL